MLSKGKVSFRCGRGSKSGMEIKFLSFFLFGGGYSLHSPSLLYLRPWRSVPSFRFLTFFGWHFFRLTLPNIDHIFRWLFPIFNLWGFRNLSFIFHLKLTKTSGFVRGSEEGERHAHHTIVASNHNCLSFGIVQIF